MDKPRMKFPKGKQPKPKERERNTERERETMVAISLYRGNMHRVPPELPRRWLMPTPKISLKDFRTLLLRRSKALSLLPSSSTATATATATATVDVAVAENPNSPAKQEPEVPEEVTVNGNPNSSPEPIEAAPVTIKVEDDGEFDFKTLTMDLVANLNDDDDDKVKVAVEECEKEKEKDNGEVLPGDNVDLEGNEKLDNADDKEKRKMEVEEKLKILNEKKHNLVQALKQILNAEEELKRRSCMQGGRPPLPSQMDASNDSGSMTRHATPRTGSEANINVDTEGGEGDDALNHNPQSRLLPHMNSTSPSAESALRKPPYFHHNAASHPSRAAIVAAGSPSRFAPSGNQGQPSNLPSVSVSGTNYVASSPSPAASGGTSGFRDARHPSPWN